MPIPCHDRHRRTGTASGHRRCPTAPVLPVALQRPDAAHCSAEAHLEVSEIYRQPGAEHSAICRELERRYEARLIARHEDEAAGGALQGDRADYRWESSVAD